MNDQGFMRAMSEVRERITRVEHWLAFTIGLVFFLSLVEIAVIFWIVLT